MATPLPKYTVQDLEKAMKAVRPYFSAMEDELKRHDNGIVSLEIRVYKGKVTDYVITAGERFII